MQLTVLGSSGTYPWQGKACSGFLVSEGDTRLLLDCGPGVLANLQAHVAIEDLTGIIITHMHPDHFLDLIPLRYALKYGEPSRSTLLPVHLPPGGREIWDRVVDTLKDSGDSFSAPFDLSEYQEGQTYRLGDVDVRFALLRHYVPSYGVEVRAGGRLVYSGDVGPCPELEVLARGADLFVCEATWLETQVPPDERGHLTATEAGEIARKAGVGSLLLTHIVPYVDAGKTLEAAKATFGGEVLLATEGCTYTVNAR